MYDGPALVAYGSVTAPPAGGANARALGAVHPTARGRGLGGDLLTWQLARAAAMRAERAPGAAWHVETHANDDDAAAARLFARSGLAPVRYFTHMRADLTGPAPVAPVPDGLRVVALSEVNPADVHRAYDDAAADYWGFEAEPHDDWLSWTYAAETFRPDLGRVALDGPDIAGYVIVFDDGDVGGIVLAEVGVRAAWRRRGLATAMIADLLGAAAADGRTHADLSVDAANPSGAGGVYTAIGFAPVHRYTAYHGALA